MKLFGLEKTGPAGLFDFSPRERENRTPLYRLYDNVFGIEDDTVTPGERLGKGVNSAAKAIYNDPIGTARNAANFVNDDLRNLMFEGGWEERPFDAFGYAAAPMAPGVAKMGRYAPDVVSANGAKPGITAYHGSPHDFDRFSMDKIGTGEGAQAYGHGLYFAESEDVAKSYRDSVGAQHRGRETNWDDPKSVGDYWAGIYGGTDEGIKHLEGAIMQAQRNPANFPQGEVEKMQKAIEHLQGGGNAPTGHMYEVNINANPDDFLDWDAPLSEQPKLREKLGYPELSSDQIHDEAIAIMDARPNGAWMEHEPSAKRIAELNDMLDGLPRDGLYGSDLYRGVTGPGGVEGVLAEMGRGYNPQGNAQKLRDAGIPGIKYRDAGSRGADGGNGTRNFVVFDDRLIDIVRKYGIAGAAPMLGLTAAELQAQMQEQGIQPPAPTYSAGGT